MSEVIILLIFAAAIIAAFLAGANVYRAGMLNYAPEIVHLPKSSPEREKKSEAEPEPWDNT